MTLLTYTTYVIIGAGIHGLSTAYHLALELEARGKGSGKDIIVTPLALRRRPRVAVSPLRTPGRR